MPQNDGKIDYAKENEALCKENEALRKESDALRKENESLRKTMALSAEEIH